jgi:hypothetical protein
MNSSIKRYARIEKTDYTANNHKLKIVEKLCDCQEVYVRVVEHIKNCLSGSSEEKNEKVIEGYEEAIDKWDEFVAIKNENALTTS